MDDLKRNDVIELCLRATTNTQIDEAERVLDLWLNAHPDDEGFGGLAGQLCMIRNANNLSAAELEKLDKAAEEYASKYARRVS